MTTSTFIGMMYLWLMTPKYYIGKTLKIEAKDVVMDFQADNYNLGTALTYIMRAGKKPHNPICDDIRKAIAHLNFELDRQDEQRATSEGSQTTTTKYAVLY